MSAERLSRAVHIHHPQIVDLMGARPSPDRSTYMFEVFGVRTWMRSYRAWPAGELTIMEAAAWFARPEHTLVGRVTSSSTPAELADLAAADQASAQHQGVKLVGAQPFLTSFRSMLRAQAWDELGVAGSEVEKIERDLSRARARRAGLLGQIIGWPDWTAGFSDNDARLGEQARMSRQAVRKFRTQFDSQDDDHATA